MTEFGPLMIDVAGTTLCGLDRENLQHPLVGGLILFSRNYENPQQIAALIQDARSLNGELLIAVDTEGGRVQRFREQFFPLPAMARIGELYDREPAEGCEAARKAGWLLASELRAIDVDLAFAPVLDLGLGRSAVIGDRALHADPVAVIELAAGFCEGMMEAGMSPTAKHFPGHGHVRPDSHQELPVDERDWSTVAATDVLPFAALAPRLPSMMMAHIRFPQIDSEPASCSERWIHEILRGRLNYNGAVFCDDLSMGGAKTIGDISQRASSALAAGCDMLPVCNAPEDVASLLQDWEPPLHAGADRRLRPLRGRPAAPDLAELRSGERYRNVTARLTELGLADA